MAAEKMWNMAREQSTPTGKKAVFGILYPFVRTVTEVAFGYSEYESHSTTYTPLGAFLDENRLIRLRSVFTRWSSFLSYFGKERSVVVRDKFRRTVPMTDRLPKVEKDTPNPTSENDPPYSRGDKLPPSESQPGVLPTECTTSPAWWKYPLYVSMGCAFCVAVLAVLVAVLKPTVWEGRQSVVIRAEVFVGGLQDAPADQKRRDLQNTFVTVLQSRAVLEGALKEVGPSDRNKHSSFPTLKDIDALREAVKIVPVAGDEFGTSDVVSVRVRDKNRARAIRLTEALVRHADQALQRLQAQRTAETTEELARSQRAAETALEADRERLEKMEADLGADGITLRLLEEKPDTSGLRSALEAFDRQIEELESRQLTYEKMLEVLVQVRETPSQLGAVPAALLDAHPTLRRLQEALTEAEVHLITLEGQYAEEHPAVIAAKLSLNQLRRRIADETPAAIEAIQHERALISSQLEYLRNQRREESARVEKLIALLPEYRTIAARVRSESQALETIRQQLNQARATQAAVASSRFVVPVEPVQTGAHPAGPGRTTIIAGGLACGLMVGLAVFLWLVPTAQSTSQKKRVEAPAPGPTPVTQEQGARKAPRQHSPREGKQQIDMLPVFPDLPLTICDEPSLLHRALIGTAQLSVTEEAIRDR
jgi:uncharacterized protein involved in exopolysaccharide biosynthesis